MKRERAYLSLGSNQGDSCAYLRQARIALAELATTDVIICSALYQNPAQEVGHQADYVNAVVAIDTALSPHALLKSMLEIERGLGRCRQAGVWGQARTLDLDLLLYGQLQMRDSVLTIPHPRLGQRYFCALSLGRDCPKFNIT